MNKQFEEYKMQFIEENGLYDKEYLSEEENDELNQKIDEGTATGNPFEDYDYEYEREYNWYKFYKKVPYEISESDLNLYIAMNILKINKSMEQKQNTMKNIIVFWYVLTFIYIGISIYLYVRFYQIFEFLYKYLNSYKEFIEHIENM